jgi:hypothetical protein
MESIKRSIMLLRPGDGPYAHPQSRGTLKLQAVPGGLAVLLTVTGLESVGHALHLFLQDGAMIFAGDVAAGGLRRTLPGIRLQSVAGAAVIHSASLSFCLKSTGIDWNDVMLRFRLLHAPRPVQRDPMPEEQPLFPVIPSDEAKPDTVETTVADISDDIPATPSGNVSDAPPIVDNEPWMPENYMPSEPDNGNEPDPCANCPYTAQQQRVDPFPTVFPHSDWVKMAYPGPTGWWHYITGRIYSGPKVVAKAVGVPGEYGMMPPVWLEGFGTYLRCDSPDAHGYWLMFQDAETGEILDMGLSPRDA